MDKSKAYRQAFEAKIDENRARVELVKARLKAVSAKSQITTAEKVKQLEHQLDELKRDASRLADATDESFEKIKGALDRKWDEYKTKLGEITRALPVKDQKEQPKLPV